MQSKPGVQRGRHTISGQGLSSLPKDNNDNRRNNNRYREYGTLPYEVTLPQRRKIFQEVIRKRKWGRPPAFIVTQEQAARSL
ncbi:hypothetical protein N657DRAFT_649200, partial [Parathielavia appendiculata]